VPGQTVCRIGRIITVGGVTMGDALEHDTLGRPMPVWRGCRCIAADEIFLMNSAVENSLDGATSVPFPPVRSSAKRPRSGPMRTTQAAPTARRNLRTRTPNLSPTPAERIFPWHI
jgi:type IV secretory pathway protease TraF